MNKLYSLYKLILLCVLALAVAPQSYAAEVADPNQVYRQNTFGAHRETVEDIRVKALGEDIRHTRSWNSGKWYFNRRWETLRIELKDSTSTEESNITIYRGAAKYEYKSSGIYAHETDSSQTIIKTGDSYHWKNRKGDWINYDENRRAVNYGNRNNVTVSFQYDAQNRLTGIFDQNNNQMFWYEYNLDGDLSLVKDYSGRKVEYKYAAGQLTEVIDVLGNSSTYTYENGQMLTKTDAEGRVTSIGYTPNGMVSGINNAGVSVGIYTDYIKSSNVFYRREAYSTGKVIEKWYDRNGDFIRKTINGEYVRQTVISGLTRTTTDRAGNRATTTYDQWDNLLSTTYPDGSKTSTEYEHVFTQPIKEINENGVITLKEYDDRGNLTKLTEASGLPEQRITIYTYDAYGNQLSKTIAADTVSVEVTTSATYDAYGNKLTMTDGEGHVTTYTYDVLGNVLTRTDSLNNVLIYNYDTKGNLLTEASPLNNITKLDYDKVGNLIKVTDALNRVTQYEYDARNNRIAVINALTQKTTQKYNADDQLVQVTDAANKSSYRTYNIDGQLVENKDGNGNSIKYEYIKGVVSGSGKIGRTIYPTYYETTSYDNRGRIIQKKQHLDANTVLTISKGYDAVGNKVSSTDAKGRVTQYIYDAQDRLIEVIDPKNNTTKFTYDNRDNLLSVTNANGAIHRYAYNKNNQKTKEIKPLGEVTQYTYDDAGQLSSEIDANSHKRVYIYDDAGRNTGIESYTQSTDAAPVKTVSFSYNEVNNRTTHSDGVTTGIYTYDGLNRPTMTTINFGGFSKSYSYTYDASGNKSSFTGADGVTMNYIYNNINQLTSLAIPDVGQVNLGNYQWMQPQTITLPGGATQNYRYDPLMRISGLELKDPAQNSLLNYGYSYDHASNIIDKQTEHGVYKYGYDDLDQLITVDNPALNDEVYSYDALGNRLTDTAKVGNWEYSLNNELSSIGTDITHSYDDHGSMVNVTKPGLVRELIYNADNRLVEVKENALSIANYSYDAFGRRVTKQADGQTTYYLYSDEGLIAEIDNTGVITKQYGWKPGNSWGTDPVFLRNNTDIYFYQNDHLGTPQKLISRSGSIVWSGYYQSFGEVNIQTQTVINNLRFPGQYYDKETQLHYNYFRDYDPQTGRYIESDPIGLRGGINIYSYVENSPVNHMDIDGLRMRKETFKNIYRELARIFEASIDTIMTEMQKAELRRLQKKADILDQLNLLDEMDSGAVNTRIGCELGCMKQRDASPCFNYDGCWSKCGSDFNFSNRKTNNIRDVMRRRLDAI